VLGGLGEHLAALLAGRLLYGLGAGGVMSAGATWLIELSSDVPLGTGARRATIALSSGFGSGALVAGVVAQYAPWPTVLPYALHVAVLGAMLVLARGAPDTGGGRPGGRLLRIELPPGMWRRFARAVVPMAPFVFAFPMIVGATLPSLLGGALGTAPIAYAGLVNAVTLAAGVLAQPVTRRFEPTTAARLGLGLGVVGIAAGAWTVHAHAPAMLLAIAIVLGAGYGIAMTAGLSAAQRLARPDARGGITGLYYVLTYVGFAVPYLLALIFRVAAPAAALAVTAAITLGVAVTLPRRLLTSIE
ncbi:MAG TPA: MFS transporter, partial [Kofleriaceae bacterium]